MPEPSVASRGLFIASAIVICLAGLKAASSLVVPFLLAMFIAIICHPIINYLVAKRLPRTLAITLVIVVIVLAFVILGSVVGASVVEFKTQLPTYEAQLTQRFVGFNQWLLDHDIILTTDILREYFNPSIAMNMVTNMLSGFGSVLTNVFLLLLTVVFMLGEATDLPAKLHLAFRDPGMKLKSLDKFLHSVNQYMLIKTFVSIATGCIISFILWVIGVDFYILWGVLAFLLNYIPNIGSIIAAIPAVILTFLQLSLGHAAVVAACYILVNTIMGNVVEPRYLGRGLGLSTLVVFLSLIFWGWLLGTVGMLLSVPLTMILKIGLENSAQGRWFAVLLSSDTSAVDELKTSK
ncbi:AI-2E family transporter [Motilimonas eburnea]|uniref:AI-2E family transporter n=1 Tax=Motilimonas eburnea TaxID=1737488 RepID=UPI001E5AF2AA|nr:AI-2E family transporter [Motilimonas eburnea]MCE2573243.1 AI-2E family transporter [Motilimonas eburnea]